MKTTYIRFRTWSLTAILVIAIAFYLLMTVTFNEKVDIINLIFLSVITITIHFIYFPDGEKCGENDTSFVSNKTAYNEKASKVTTNGAVKKLRAYCEYEYNERKKQYITTKCGQVGITVDEYEFLKTLPPLKVKEMNEFQYDGKTIYITKESKKELLRLLYKALPVEENNADSILSACEIDYTKSITDTSKNYRRQSHLRKCLYGVLVSLFLAYIGYTFKGGITLETIALFITYIANMCITAIFSFGRGETTQKVYKNRYYLELSNYLDCFFEWQRQE